MSEILNDIKKDTSNIDLKIRDMIPSILSDTDKVRLHENLSPAIDELDRISKNYSVIVPRAKGILAELLDDTSKIRKDIDGLLRAKDDLQITHYKNLLFDDTFVLRDRFRKVRMLLEALTFRPTRITIISVFYTIFGILGLIRGMMLVGIASPVAYYVSSYSRTYGFDISAVFSILTFIIIIFLIVNIIDFIVGYGLWKMRLWGAKLGIIVTSLSIIADLIFLLIMFTIPSMDILLGFSFFILTLHSLGVNIIFIAGIASAWKYYQPIE
ncbi:MAG: hypothetical protein QG670_2196 [Thermoproteota archaeon]|nr:hypothetical protein [Thermoproteota archaeon]